LASQWENPNCGLSTSVAAFKSSGSTQSSQQKPADYSYGQVLAIPHCATDFAIKSVGKFRVIGLV